MHSRDDARALLDQVLRLTTAPEAEASLAGLRQDLTRFANNAIHQNVSEDNLAISLRVAFGRRSGRATSGRTDPAALQRLVHAAEETARLAPEDPDLLPVPEPQTCDAGAGYRPGTEDVDPVVRARRVVEAIDLARTNGLSAAGYLATGAQLLSHANSRGLFAHQVWTQAAFSATVTAPDATGWVTESSPDLADLDVRRLAGRAVEKALRGRAPGTLAPGEYTVVLEPAAVADLLWFLAPGFNARQVEEKQSFLTGRVGRQVFGANFTLADDVRHPLQSGPVFDGEGLPRCRVALVTEGVAHGLVWDRATAARRGGTATGHGLPVPNTIGAAAQHLEVAGGDATLERMIESTPRGVLVTRFWYNRLVEPMQVVVTGMTRDGTFEIEDGRVTRGLRNLRYNQSVVAMLNHITMLGRAVRAGVSEASPMVAPAMKVERFRFDG